LRSTHCSNRSDQNMSRLISEFDEVRMEAIVSAEIPAIDQ